MKKKPSSVLRFAYQDADDVAEQFSRRFSPVKIKSFDRKGLIDMTGRYGRLNGIDFNRTDFGVGFEIFPQQKDTSYFFLFPSTGAVDVGVGARCIQANIDMATASYGEEMDSVRFHAGLKKTAIAIERSLVVTRLSRLLDAAVPSEVVFDPVVDQSKDRIPALRSYVSFLVNDDFSQSIEYLPRAARQVADTFADLLLEVWPHNFSEALARQPCTIAPRHVRRAVEYIKANPYLAVTVDDLADVCGVSIRALQYGFQRFVGSSIAQYERRSRLEAARRLLAEHNDLSVAEVARLYSFSNVHRFGLQFREAFGISPNDFKGQSAAA